LSWLLLSGNTLRSWLGNLRMELLELLRRGFAHRRLRRDTRASSDGDGLLRLSVECRGILGVDWSRVGRDLLVHLRLIPGYW
jgi:hypothetical protein